MGLTKMLQRGDRPACLTTMKQCRGCFGWRNMLRAAQQNDMWQRYPFRCALTGLTLKVSSGKEAADRV